MPTTTRRETPALFWAIVILVVLLPLPLGAVYEWSGALMSVTVGVVLLVWCARVGLGLQEPTLALRTLWPLALPFALVFLWVLVQASSMTPATWHHPLWSSAREALGDVRTPAISLDPFETMSGLMRIVAYAGIFWIALQYCHRSNRARQVLTAVVYAGLGYALYGLVVYLTGSESILIFRKTVYLGDVTSVFVNRNTYATYAGLGLVCTTGLLLVLATQALAPAPTRKERMLRLIEVGMGRGWPLLLAWIALLLTLVLSHSRAGFFSTLLGLLTLLAAAGLTRAVDRWFALVFGGLCAVGLAWVLGIEGDQLLLRLLQTSMAFEERPVVYDLTLAAIEDAGVFGTGFATFEEAFRFYRTPAVTGYFDMAHNTYLENVLELGIPSAVILFSIFFVFVVLCVLGLRRRRRDAVYPCVGLAATILVAAHAAVDFSLQIPAVTGTYALVMGAACAQCWSSRRPQDAW